jgi:peroxiredoxin family protein
MATEIERNSDSLQPAADLDRLIEERVEAAMAKRFAALDEMMAERMAQALKRDPARRKAAIIASKGTLDMAYPPLILATAAAAMDMEVGVFFTFYGLNILKKNGPRKLKVAPIANPGMPMAIPNVVGMLPGMTPMATKMMKGMFAKKQVVTVGDLLQQAIELDVKLIACQMTMDVLGFKRKDLIEQCEVGGAASFLSFASTAHTTLFI